ncbi:hypothetical protein Leryth_011862 [Lithospermum erythrorhizon]|nr:hypothetical protein Leryth_011862 [Lithospermum erythrorhizon]
MDDGKFDRNSANTIKNNKKMKNTQDSIQQFEYCKACKLNHNQGRKHIYFPNHKKAFSAFLARFESKLADVRFFLKNPSVLKPEYASQNRVWCVFCDEDIVEIQSKFACGKAIRHLASSDHLKKVKALLWKYGGRMDGVDSYCISETDLMKWEKKCLSLEKTVIAEGRPRPPLIGPVNDIHSELNSNYINSNGITNDYGFYNISNDVLPLQKSTNEKTQVSSQVVGNTMGVGSEPHKMHLGNNCQTEICASGHTHSHHSSYSAALNCSGSGKFANRNVSNFLCNYHVSSASFLSVLI